MDVPAVTVNKVCLSGIDAIYLADQMIRSGDADVVVAGGMESMTQAPHLLPGSRRGFRLGDVTLVDSMISDGLWCSFDGVHMGAGTEAYATAASISRAAQDEIAARSHERAATAIKEGRFADEIVPVPVPQKGAPRPRSRRSPG
jgi:acetyl-CoA C-acetyltransferase